MNGSGSTHYFIYTLAVWGMVYLLVGRRIYNLWKPGLIGVGIMAIIDLIAIKYNPLNWKLWYSYFLSIAGLLLLALLSDLVDRIGAIYKKPH